LQLAVGRSQTRILEGREGSRISELERAREKEGETDVRLVVATGDQNVSVDVQRLDVLSEPSTPVLLSEVETFVERKPGDKTAKRVRSDRDAS